jgi:hypothetical protein
MIPHKSIQFEYGVQSVFALAAIDGEQTGTTLIVVVGDFFYVFKTRTEANQN